MRHTRTGSSPALLATSARRSASGSCTGRVIARRVSRSALAELPVSLAPKGAGAIAGPPSLELSPDDGGRPGCCAELLVVPEPSTLAAAAAALGRPVRIVRPRVGSRRDVPVDATARP